MQVPEEEEEEEDLQLKLLKFRRIGENYRLIQESGDARLGRNVYSRISHRKG